MVLDDTQACVPGLGRGGAVGLLSALAAQWMGPALRGLNVPQALSKGLGEGSDGECVLHSSSDPFPV